MTAGRFPRVALIGAGQMSTHHARVIRESDSARLAVIVDTNEERARALADASDCRWSTDLAEAAACDAVVVASTTESHGEIALELLEAGRPLLIEKPVSHDIDQVAKIVEASERGRVPIMCGFVERFNPVLATAADLLDESPIHLVALRHSPPAPRISTSVVYDMLIHDIDLALRFMAPSSSTGMSATRPAPAELRDEIADCSISFDDGRIATLSSSRLSQRKIRHFLISTRTLLIDADLLRSTLSVYRHVQHEQVAEATVAYRAETVIDIPFVRHAGEPLALQFEHFIRLADGRADADAERASILPPHRLADDVTRS